MTETLRPWSELDESELVTRAQQRDEAAFAELMRRNTSPSLRLAISVLKDRQEAEDQLQTSFLKAWTGLTNFQQESKFSTWFRRIVLNQSLMRLRSVRRAKLQSLDAHRPVPGRGRAIGQGAGGEDLQARTDGGIGIDEDFERLAVEGAFLFGVLVPGMNGVFVLGEEVLAALFGMDGGTIEDGAELGFRRGVTENIDLLIRAVVFAGEDKKLEEEGTALNVGRVVPDLDVQRRDGFLQLSCFVQFLGCHSWK